MNCANHFERPATAYCQSCGKPLCPECIRSADGLILCEPCLVARQTTASSANPAWSAASSATSSQGAPFGVFSETKGNAATTQGSAAQPVGSVPGTATSGWNAMPPSAGSPGSQAGNQPGEQTGNSAGAQGGYPAGGFGGVPGSAAGPFAQSHSGQRPSSQPNPFVAGTLGFIPGVGAMYNGQFVKALLHVVIFIVLVGASKHFHLLGMLVATWVFYQVFDAAQTAAARRDNRPLPDPFGILDMSQRLGPQTGFHPGTGAGFQAGGYPPPPSYPVAYPPTNVQQPHSGSARQSDSSPFTQSSPASAPYGVPVGATSGRGWAAQPHHAAQPNVQAPSPPSPVQPLFAPQQRGEPIGAIVLIVVGLLFLLSTLGLLGTNWIWRGWPVLVMLLGVWLLFRRLRAPVPFAPLPGAPVPITPQNTAPAGNPLSITPQFQGAPPVQAAEQSSATGNDQRTVHVYEQKREEK